MAEQVRRRLALVAMHLGSFATDQLGWYAEKRREAAPEIARELI